METMILILVALVILLIWGPSKIPGLARAIGEAIREFRRGSREVIEEKEEKKESIDPKLVELAQKLGIDIKGKTQAQILEEINRKLEEKKTSQQ